MGPLPYVSLVLLSLSTGLQAWTAPEFCHDRPCPQYKLLETNEGFEERLYDATQWMTTKVKSSGTIDGLDAHNRLKDYCQRQNQAGFKISCDTWPVLVGVEGGGLVTLSWFVPPGTTLPDNTDPLVTLQSRPAFKVYVRHYEGLPSAANGLENVRQLRESLVSAKKTFDPYSYYGAGYDRFLSLYHYNEVWVHDSEDLS